jgi:hypothetical protein
MPRPFLLVTLASIFAILAAAAPVRVLFIGNSYTAQNNLPVLVQTLAEANDQTVVIATHLRGGRTFQQHWNEALAAEVIRRGGWDVIVLQNQSYEPVGDPANMLKYAQLFAGVIAEATPQARVILYNTWAYLDLVTSGGHQNRYPLETRPASAAEMQHRLNAAYATTAATIGAEIAPVGQAWALAFAAQPGLRLHRDDGSHPQPEGSLLAALVIHARLFGQVATHVPARFTLPGTADRPVHERELHFDAALRTFLVQQAQAALAQP